MVKDTLRLYPRRLWVNDRVYRNGNTIVINTNTTNNNNNNDNNNNYDRKANNW